MTDRIGLIIGVGSVGRRHAKVMATRYSELVVVEPRDDARDWVVSEASATASCFASLADAKYSLQRHADQITAVVANWGPDHAETIQFLVSCGVRRIVCEKPLANSMHSVAKIRALIESHDLSIAVGYHLRYRGVTEFVKSTSERELGGSPTLFIVDGGARCISTTGSHYLDLAIGVFGALPVSVIASLRGAPMNPRSDSLQYWDGVAVWNFPAGQRLAVCYDNSSSVYDTARFYSPTGVLEIDSNLTARAYSRDLAEVRADPRTVRVGVVRREQPVAEFSFNFQEVLSIQLDEVEGLRPPRYTFDEILNSAEALIAAFESSRLGRRVLLPPSPEIIAGGIDWAIS